MVTAEQNSVAPGGSSCNANGDGTGIAAALGVPNHLSARYRRDEFFGQFDFQFVIDRVNRAVVDLFFNCLVHDGITVTKDDCSDAADPVDVSVSVEVCEICPLSTDCVNGRNASSESGRPATDQLRASGDEFTSPLIKFHLSCDAVFV